MIEKGWEHEFQVLRENPCGKVKKTASHFAKMLNNRRYLKKQTTIKEKVRKTNQTSEEELNELDSLPSNIFNAMKNELLRKILSGEIFEFLNLILNTRID